MFWHEQSRRLHHAFFLGMIAALLVFSVSACSLWSGVAGPERADGNRWTDGTYRVDPTERSYTQVFADMGLSDHFRGYSTLPRQLQIVLDRGCAARPDCERVLGMALPNLILMVSRSGPAFSEESARAICRMLDRPYRGHGKQAVCGATMR